MSVTGTVLVVANVGDPDAGYVGDRFTERGWALAPVWREEGLPAQPPAGTVAVLLLGSEWSVAHPVRPDVLEAESVLVRSAERAGVPVLGLCYGAQVLAHAYGGRVATAEEPEVGLVTVETFDDRLVPPGPWWAFHRDVVDVPPQAQLVARNGCGVQAFRLPRALAVQFHPEVRPSVLEGWLGRLPSMAAASGRTGPELVALAKGREPQARAAAHALVDDFIAEFLIREGGPG